MEPDYPAAHSMDTTWFAVDRDGHVAVFDSGEAGAVPAAVAIDDGTNISERLREALPQSGIIYDLASRTMAGPAGQEQLHDHAWFQSPVLLVLSSLDPVREALAAGRAERVNVTEGVAVILRGLSEEELNRYRDSANFRGCCNVYLGEGFPHSLAHHGLYEYGHITENWISGPYGREAVPERPLHIDQLPPDLREQIDGLRLPLCFAETPRLQPVDLAECISWEPAYLDVTGQRIRPIPGKEDEYAEIYEQLTEAGNEGFEVEPPSDK
jgi:hypothetical protein